jgi:Domain of unknown function (DUF4270)
MNTNNKPLGSFRIERSVLIIFISYLFFNACKKNPSEFTLGKEFIESQTELTLIDTFSVSLSTVILDTVITSGTGNLLIGNYRDEVFGKTTSHSYFQIGIPGNVDLENDDIYDSLKLVIKYNGYSFGDTTKSQKISVHRLTKNIEFDDDNGITSKTSFAYDPQPIGSIIYTPEPNGPIDTLAIKISDGVGLDLFTKLRDGSEILNATESFINYFHGLVLVADKAYEGSIVGFNANDVKLILYTTRGALSAEKISYEFGLENSLKQFNNITHDFSSTQLNPLVEQRNELSSTATGGLSFLQGGIGLAIRVDFPSLPEILLLRRGRIMDAQLSISPLRSSYNDFDLPPELDLYESDKLNRRNALVLDKHGAVASSTLILDELYHEETAYSFDVTEYLIDELSDSYVDPEKGLLMMLPSNDLNARFGRLIADARNRNTKLKIYYLFY